MSVLTRIVVYRDGRVEREAALEESLTIGRAEDNTLALRERNVSRRHCRLVRENDAVFLEDSSRYGVRLNGKRITERARVRHNDLIVVGDFSLAVDDAALGERAVTSARTDATALLNRTQTSQRVEGRPSVALAPPYITLARHPVAYERWPLKKTVLSIGSDAGCDIVVTDAGIEKQHAAFEIGDGAARIVSVEGSLRVNGEAYADTQLRNGDEVVLGSARFVAWVPADLAANVAEPDEQTRTSVHALPRRGRLIQAMVIGGSLVVSVAIGTALSLLIPRPPTLVVSPRVEDVVAPDGAASQASFAASEPVSPSSEPAVKKRPSKAVAVAPTADQRIAEAVQVAKDGDRNTALQMLEAVVKDAPRSARAYYNLGVLYDLEKNPSAAKEAYVRFIALAPNHPNASRVAERVKELGD